MFVGAATAFTFAELVDPVLERGEPGTLSVMGECDCERGEPRFPLGGGACSNVRPLRGERALRGEGAKEDELDQPRPGEADNERLRLRAEVPGGEADAATTFKVRERAADAAAAWPLLSPVCNLSGRRVRLLDELALTAEGAIAAVCDSELAVAATVATSVALADGGLGSNTFARALPLGDLGDCADCADLGDCAAA
jgi:hypothetical protein